QPRRAAGVAVAPAHGQHARRPQGRDVVLRAGAHHRTPAVPAARPAGVLHPGPGVLHPRDGLHQHGDRARGALKPAVLSLTTSLTAPPATVDLEGNPMKRTIKILASAVTSLVVLLICSPAFAQAAETAETIRNK